MSAICLTLSNEVQYSFEFSGTTLNQRAIPEVVCHISWSTDNGQEQWTTSFTMYNLDIQAHLTANHLVNDETTADIKVITVLYEKVVDAINKSKGTT